MTAGAPAASADRALLTGSRVVAVPAAVLVAAIVGASFLVRMLAALARPTPTYFPDEYLYQSLADSIATSGQPLVRGASAHFAALLQPLLTAPFWLLEPLTAYRLTQALNALAISLAAVPVYFLARRLALGPGFPLGAAAVAVCAPGGRYAGFVLADPIAYALVLAGLWLGVRVLAKPTIRGQLAFAGLSGLAAFARLQYAVLPVVFLGAALIVERGSLARMFGRFKVSVAVVSLALAGSLVAGPTRLFGAYSSLLHVELDANRFTHWLAVHAMLICYSAGIVIVPGAVLGLVLAVIRPRDREEAGFAALTSLLSLGLLFEAALISEIDSQRFQERYLIVLPPLLTIAFGVAMRRSRLFWPTTALAAALLLVSARIPLAGYAEGHGNADSPTLSAVLWLGDLVGTADASLLVAAAAALLALAAVAIAARPARGGAAGLALVALACAGLSGGASAYDVRNSTAVRAAYLPSDLRWVDHAGLGAVALVLLPGSDRGRAHDQLFWNRSIKQVLLLRNEPSPDGYAASRVTPDHEGVLRVGPTPFRGPLLLETTGSTALLDGARRVRRGPGFDLWDPRGRPRFALLATGRYDDGWLAPAGRLSVWPAERSRALELTVELPDGGRAARLEFAGTEVRRVVRLRPGERRQLRFAVPAEKRWSVEFSAPARGQLVGGRPVSLKMTEPNLLWTHG